jgi:hypothetical protein
MQQVPEQLLMGQATAVDLAAPFLVQRTLRWAGAEP